jgi:hypothetical protein
MPTHATAQVFGLAHLPFPRSADKLVKNIEQDKKSIAKQ